MLSLLKVRPENISSSRIISGAFTPFLIMPVSNCSTNKLILQYDEKVHCVNLKIFTRWGSLIYESDNYDNNWDGANVTAGTYYYEITASSRSWPSNKSHRGWIVVVK